MKEPKTFYGILGFTQGSNKVKVETKVSIEGDDLSPEQHTRILRLCYMKGKISREMLENLTLHTYQVKEAGKTI